VHIDIYTMLIGFALIVGGTVAVIFSAPLSRAIANQQRERFGPVGEKVADKANSRSLVPAGIIMIALGVVGVLLGILR
jgi:uncharacterized membrane protein